MKRLILGILIGLAATAVEAQTVTLGVGSDSTTITQAQYNVLARYKVKVNAQRAAAGQPALNDAEALVDLAKRGWDEIKNQQAREDIDLDTATMDYLRTNQASLPAAVRNGICNFRGQPNGCTF